MRPVVLQICYYAYYFASDIANFVYMIVRYSKSLNNDSYESQMKCIEEILKKLSVSAKLLPSYSVRRNQANNIVNLHVLLKAYATQ